MTKITIRLRNEESLSGSAAKRRSRLQQLAKVQHHRHKISDIIALMSRPEFNVYFRNQFQAYLRGIEDIETSGDKQSSDDAYLDVVAFLQSMFDNMSQPKHISVEDRDNMEMIGKRNSRMGDRKGITYTQHNPDNLKKNIY